MVPKDWIYAHNATCVKNKKYFNEDTGRFIFSDITNKDGTRTPKKFVYKFGVSFIHGGVMYNNSAHNINCAVARFFEKQELKDEEGQMEINNLSKFGIDCANMDLDKNLFINSTLWCQYNTELLKQKITDSCGIHEYHYDLRDAAYLTSIEKHVKMLMRQHKFAVLKESDGYLIDSAWVELLEWKIKFLEVAKQGGFPRIIVDAIMENSLPVVHFANSWKAHTANKTIHFSKYVRVTFCASPNPDDISEMFNKILFHSEPGITIYNYSDDAIIVFLDANGVIKIFNIDVSKNDRLHNRHTEKTLGIVSNMPSPMLKFTLSLITAKFIVRNPQFEKEYCVLKLNYDNLPSGVGTTSVSNNNVYNMGGCEMGKQYDHNNTDHNTIAFLTYIGYVIGFRFSYQEVTKPGKLQFLKNSPILREDGSGLYSCMPNLGILLRYSGGVELNIPPKIVFPKYCDTQFKKHAYMQSLLTFGFFKYYRYEKLCKYLCPYFENIIGFKEVRTEKNLALVRRYHDNEHNERQVIHLSSQQMYYRYDLTQLQIQIFEELVASSSCGSYIACELVDIVLLADYGLKF
jgi:hypothetical protein